MPPRQPLRSTDASLMQLARVVPLAVPLNMTVLYAEDEGAALAREFVQKHPGHLRLDDVLQHTAPGRQLWAGLTSASRPWEAKEEVWWELSWRLARTARGVVHVFGPRRLVEDRPLEEARHKYATNKHANTVFEKIELPELEANESVTAILYNGRPFD